MQIPTPYGFVIFCDDVRKEVTDKELFIGIYSEKLIVSEMPVALPKFFIVIHYIETAGENDQPVFIEVTTPENGPDEPVISKQIPVEVLRDHVAKGRLPKGARLTVRVHIEFPTLPITKAGDIVVTFKTGDKIVELGRLIIERGSVKID